MPHAGPAFSRRTLLLTAATGTLLVACGGRRTASPSATADAAALQQAVASERALLGGYDALLARSGSDPSLAQRRSDHARHLEAMLALLPATSSPVASTPALFPDPPTADDLGGAERVSVTALQSAAVAARDGATAAALASVAASHAAHASRVGR